MYGFGDENFLDCFICFGFDEVHFFSVSSIRFKPGGVSVYLISHKVITFEKPTTNPFWYNWFYLNRVAQKVELDWEGKKIVFWNVHLEAFDEKTREEQLKKLSSLILLSENKKVIVAGDFNADNPMIENFKSTESFSTYPSWSPNEKLDHIFYSSFFNLNKSDKSSGVEASDHLAVWAEFK